MRFGILLISIFLLGLLASCVSIDQTDPNSALPSNRPATWEGRTIGAPL